MGLYKKIANHFLKRVSDEELSELISKFGTTKSLLPETLLREIDVHGQKFQVSHHWFWDQYDESGWEPNTYSTLKKYLNEETKFVDIGAWVGLTSMWANTLGVKQVYAIEANPKSYELLLRTINNNTNLLSTVELTNVCITDKDEEFVRFGRDLSSASRLDITGEYQVKTSRLKTYIDQRALKENLFIKVDIEGAELLILQDLHEILCGRNKAFMALHPTFWSDKQSGHDLILDFLKDFSVYNDEGVILDLDELSAMILTKDEYPSWGTPHGNFFEILIESKDH